MLVLETLENMDDSWITHGHGEAFCRTISDTGARWLEGVARRTPGLLQLHPRLEAQAGAYAAAWRVSWAQSVRLAREAELADRKITALHALQRVSGAVAESLLRKHETVSAVAALPTDNLTRTQRVVVLGTSIMVLFTVEVSD